jgi:nitrogen fixation/metabolism regulation signal transduction histidine kinase
MKHERRVLLSSALGSLPAVAVAILLLWLGSYPLELQITLTILILIFWIGGVVAVHQRVVYPLRTVSNMLAALRERDFSHRARGASGDDAMGELLLEVNSLAEMLREQRLGALEANALLRRVMAEIDVAIFAFDRDEKLLFANQYGEQLLGKTVDHLTGSSASDLGLRTCLNGQTPRIESIVFPGGQGRWEVRRGTFLERGQPQRLLVLADMTSALREQERQAWQRLVQVLGHEANNSLAPIQSLAQSLAKLLNEPRMSDWDQDLREGLGVIASRSQSLNRFMSAYTKLTKLPPPTLREVHVAECVRRVANLETRIKVILKPGPDITIRADADQLEQLLINLVRNAAEAVEGTAGLVEIGWSSVEGASPWCEIWVDDEGRGLSNTSNVFVPFYTTKPNGSGIGLALCRQIAEGHLGTVTLENRVPGPGCRAVCRLPLR